MKFLLTMALAASLAGCRSGSGDVESISNPVPGAETHAHGYETADGATVKYGDVETGDRASGGGGGGGGTYDGRAVAK